MIMKHTISCVLIIFSFTFSYAGIFDYIKDKFYIVMDSGLGIDNYQQMQAELAEKKSQFDSLERSKKIFSDELSSTIKKLNEQLDIVKKLANPSQDEISNRKDYIDLLLARGYQLDEKLLEYRIDMDVLASSMEELKYRAAELKEKDKPKPITSIDIAIAERNDLDKELKDKLESSNSAKDLENRNDEQIAELKEMQSKQIAELKEIQNKQMAELKEMQNKQMAELKEKDDYMINNESEQVASSDDSINKTMGNKSSVDEELKTSENKVKIDRETLIKDKNSAFETSSLVI